ncbi:MAG: branched-chain amino acid aminotransferase/4-amino-4-deoxychorismate lyase [Flammeovirgaceae bacterium]
MNTLAFFLSKTNSQFEFIEEDNFTVSYKNRAFQYGDGMFETIIVKGNEIQHLNLHLNRLKNGLSVLGFEGLEKVDGSKIEKAIVELLERNQINENARVKIAVWRAEGGLYTPQNQGFEMLISVSKHQTQTELKYIDVDFCQQVRNNYSAFSAYKTLSSLPYTMAGLERKTRNLDDIILLDSNGNISECLASSIFWERDGIFYTPSLKSGCIAGIRREIITKFLRKNSFIVRRKLAKKAELLKANFVFNANVASIQLIGQIGKVEIPENLEMKQLLQELL